MANPRKFSEKIALHNQKQAEETARFEQIMREVSDATNKTELPNALSNFEELNQSDRGDAQIYRDSRVRSVGPIRQRPIERRIDTSPYGHGGPYLSPPPDTNWRRTNSDSALHQSTQDVGQRRQHHDNQILGTLNFNDKGSEQRPKSCYDSSPVPGINIYPSHNDPGAVQIPIGNNTGSLPDLTSFHFPSPLPTPLDQEDHSSSFSTSPQGTSPSTLSPTSLPSRSQPAGRFPFGGSSPQESRVPSPHSNIHSQVQNQQVHSPSQRRRFYPPQQNLVISPHSPGGPHSPTPTSPLQNHLNVPSHISSSYLHQSKGVTQDHSGSVSVDGYSQQKFFCSPVGSPLVNCSLSPQPPDLTQQQQMQQQHQQQQHQNQLNSLNSFRSPQPNRPSPQNSPGLQPYRSASPGDSHNSAPQSPASPAGSPSANPFSSDSYIINQALQQHFEQFNMMDTPTTANITYIPNTTSATQVMSPEDGISQELGTDPGYYSTSPSQLQYNRPTGNGSNHQTTPQTPNTPSSIPDIILTDFSSNATDDLSKTEFVKDLGSAMSGTFDSDFFPDESSLREELGAIDIAGFQMLTNPDMNVLSDPTAEDHFRLDRLDHL